ncbi:unnamed protein product [Lupinus luteus]|uniref:Uncharacterized protein n=1 Tax=Lupinus luteus TaxID=3873 RepID=A0AAV1X666_LUPLU
MRGITTHTQAMYAQSSVAVGMKGASKAMAAMNKQMAPAKQLKIMQEFQKQSAQFDMTAEMMSYAIDDVLDSDEVEEETEELTNQVFGTRMGTEDPCSRKREYTRSFILVHLLVHRRLRPVLLQHKRFSTKKYELRLQYLTPRFLCTLHTP